MIDLAWKVEMIVLVVMLLMLVWFFWTEVRKSRRRK